MVAVVVVVVVAKSRGSKEGGELRVARQAAVAAFARCAKGRLVTGTKKPVAVGSRASRAVVHRATERRPD